MSKPTTPGKPGLLPRRRQPSNQSQASAQQQKPPPKPKKSVTSDQESGRPSGAAPIRRRPPPAVVKDIPDDQAGGYEVGYGKPPRSGRFKEGQVANPFGRGGKSRGTDEDTLLECVLAELDQSVAITEGSKSKRVRKIRVLAKSLINKALKGDNVATKTLIALLSNAALRRAGGALAQPIEAELSATDTDILEQYRLQCIEAHLKSKGPAK
jgi:hypothetical protein